MTKIINVLNNGNKDGAKVGEVSIGSFNVKPTTITAAPAPATIAISDFNKFDYFKIAQTSAATDEFDLPSNSLLPVGTRIWLYAVSAFELRTATDADKINNVASKGYTTTAGDLLECIKVTTDGWMVKKRTILGADATVVATVTP